MDGLLVGLSAREMVIGSAEEDSELKTGQGLFQEDKSKTT
jgi:hypothetical protein